MAVYRRSSRARYVLALLVLASITLVTVDSRDSGAFGSVRGDAHAVLNPITNLAHDALAPIGNFLTGAADYGSLKQQNDALRSQIAGMQSEAAVEQAAQAEASQIIAQAHLPFASNLAKVTATVVGQNPENYDVQFEINKGTSSGIADGYPVVTQAGLVGTVVAVTSSQATVRALTDPAFTVGVNIPGGTTGQAATGEASGAGPAKPLAVSGVNTTTAVAKGTVLLTSGLATETFPPGIPVGKVRSVTANADGLQETLLLTPLVSPSKLSVVSVLIYSPQTP